MIAMQVGVNNDSRLETNVTETEFVAWLRGFIEGTFFEAAAAETGHLSKEHVKEIRSHLKGVIRPLHFPTVNLPSVWTSSEPILKNYTCRVCGKINCTEIHITSTT